jgi:glycine reductase
MIVLRVVHYINQFFAGMGAAIIEGPVGPGLLVQRLLGGDGAVVATVVCGDDYFTAAPAVIAAEVLDLLADREFDLFLAGPAFNAGRYGIACGEMCVQIQEKRNVPAVTGMFEENPGVDQYRRSAYIVQTAGSAVDMGKAVPKMLALGRKMCEGYQVTRPADEGCFARNIAVNVLASKTAGARAVDMLLHKMRNEPYVTEIPAPADAELVPPAEPIEDLRTATIALVTEGGLVPVENPDRIESSRATRFGSYLLSELEAAGREGFQSIHGGFNTDSVNEDLNRLLPVDVAREMEKEGLFARLFPRYFVTTGVATTIGCASSIGKGIAQELLGGGVSGVILTAT